MILENLCGYGTRLVGGDLMTDILIVEDDKEVADFLTVFRKWESYIVLSTDS